MFKVLIVDDEEAAREGIRKALQREGGYEIYAAESVQAARQRIEKERRFDVIVVDLKFPEGDRAGGEIVKSSTGKSTITIVITAYGSIENCAQLMKAGAYDYIEKKGDGYERLLKSIREGLEERATPKPDPDANWVDKNLSMLLEKYPSRYVAVLDEQVIADAPTIQELRKKLDEEFPKQNPKIISIPAMEERSRIG